jgi:hypothetical protein
MRSGNTARLVAGLALAIGCLAQKPVDPYEEGIRLLRNQDWRGAAAQLERAVLLQTKSVEAQIALHRAASIRRRAIR